MLRSKYLHLYGTKDNTLLAYCDEETLEERIVRLREAGLSEEEIDRLTLEIPKTVIEAVKGNKKLFTQEDVTKFRQDERRKVEGNKKYNKTKTKTEYEETEDEEDDDDVVIRSSAKLKDPAGITQEQIEETVSQLVAKALEGAKSENTELKKQLDTLSTKLKEDNNKRLEKLKANLTAKLPEDVRPLLTGTTEEELETNFSVLNGFVEKTRQEVKASLSAEQETHRKEKSMFFVAEDKTEFETLNDLMLHKDSAKYLAEYKKRFA